MADREQRRGTWGLKFRNYKRYYALQVRCQWIWIQSSFSCVHTWNKVDLIWFTLWCWIEAGLDPDKKWTSVKRPLISNWPVKNEKPSQYRGPPDIVTPTFKADKAWRKPAFMFIKASRIAESSSSNLNLKVSCIMCDISLGPRSGDTHYKHDIAKHGPIRSLHSLEHPRIHKMEQQQKKSLL